METSLNSDFKECTGSFFPCVHTNTYNGNGIENACLFVKVENKFFIYLKNCQEGYCIEESETEGYRNFKVYFFEGTQIFTQPFNYPVCQDFAQICTKVVIYGPYQLATQNSRTWRIGKMKRTLRLSLPLAFFS